MDQVSPSLEPTHPSTGRAVDARPTLRKQQTRVTRLKKQQPVKTIKPVFGDGPFPIALSLRETAYNLELFDGTEVENGNSIGGLSMAALGRLKSALLTYSVGMATICKEIKTISSEADTAVAHIWKLFNFLLIEAQPYPVSASTSSVHGQAGLGEYGMQSAFVDQQFIETVQEMIVKHETVLSSLREQEAISMQKFLQLQNQIQLTQTKQQKYETARTDAQLALSEQEAKLSKISTDVTDLETTNKNESRKWEQMTERVAMKREDIGAGILKINALKTHYQQQSSNISQQNVNITKLRQENEHQELLLSSLSTQALQVRQKIDAARELVASATALGAQLPVQLASATENNAQIQVALVEARTRLAAAEELLAGKEIELSTRQEVLVKRTQKIDKLKTERAMLDNTRFQLDKALEKVQLDLREAEREAAILEEVWEEVDNNYGSKTEQLVQIQNKVKELTATKNAQAMALAASNMHKEQLDTVTLRLRQQVAVQEADWHTVDQKLTELNRLLARKKKKKAVVDADLAALRSSAEQQLTQATVEKDALDLDLDTQVQQKIVLDAEITRVTLERDTQRSALQQVDLEVAEKQALIEQLEVNLTQAQADAEAAETATAQLAKDELQANTDHQRAQRVLHGLQADLTQKQGQFSYFETLVTDKQLQVQKEHESAALSKLESERALKEQQDRQTTLEEGIIKDKVLHHRATVVLQDQLDPIQQRIQNVTVKHTLWRQDSAARQTVLEVQLEPLATKARLHKNSAAKLQEQLEAFHRANKVLVQKKQTLLDKSASLEARRAATTLRHQNTVNETKLLSRQTVPLKTAWLSATQTKQQVHSELQHISQVKQQLMEEQAQRDVVPFKYKSAQTPQSWVMTNTQEVQTPNWLLYDVHQNLYLGFRAQHECSRTGNTRKKASSSSRNGSRKSSRPTSATAPPFK